MRQFQRTALSIAAAHAAFLLSGVAMGQTVAPPAAAASAPKPDTAELSTVVVTGQRAALASAQSFKQNADEIVDSIVAADIGKLPDHSVTEVLQRIVGVTMDHTAATGDPQHFSVEGSNVTIRGLSYVRSELNGGDSFSANGGRSLSFEDVSPELMSAVDVYKNPSAEQIEGGISGLVNLRTALPFDYKGFKAAISAQRNYSALAGKSTPSVSGLVSDRWNTDLGEFGALLDLAHSDAYERTDGYEVSPYYPVSSGGSTVWLPDGVQWRQLGFDRKRAGTYAALQYRKGDVDSSLTYFKSKYKMAWTENGFVASTNAYNLQVAPGATFSPSGAFLKGTLTDSTDGGVNFNDDTRVASRDSTTQDVSWNLHWRANDQWSFKSSLQLIRATTNGFDSTVADGITVPEENVDLTGSHPNLTFSPADTAYMSNPANYYWAWTMEHFDKSTATEKAWHGDATYKFENNPILDDLRFGVRFTDREAETINSVPFYNWEAITQPWQVGWDINHVAYLNDPRFSGNSAVYSFKNFFGKNNSVPALIFPTAAMALNFPGSYATLHSYHDILCAEETAANGWGSGCPTWTPATLGIDPAGTNDQAERTQAAYSQLRFGFDDLPMPIDGNIGIRVVHTDADAHGYTIFSSIAPTIPAGANLSGVAIPQIAPFSKAENFTNSYTDVLPTLNLRMKASNNLQYRFAYSTAMSRPDFSQLQAYTNLTQSATTHTVSDASGNVTSVVVDAVSQNGSASGNPMLKPTKSNQFDFSSEWYFSKTGSLTFAVFDKELKDIIINQTQNVPVTDVNGDANNFTVTSPVNGAKGYARGFELAFQRYLDMLPGWLSGFGVQANYTFVDSKQKLYSPVNPTYCSSSSNGADNISLNLNGCDTNGVSFTNLPLQNLSRTAYNLAFLYDQGPISARVAYSWRSKYLQGVNVTGTSGTDGTDTNPQSSTFGQHTVAYGLPTWALSYGEVDASFFYKVDDKLTLGLEVQNLTNSTYKQVMQQHIGMMGMDWFTTGRRYTMRASYSF